MAVSKALMSSVKGDWRTPPEVIELVQRVAPIWLDPCPHHDSCFHPLVEYHLSNGKDGLELSWRSADQRAQTDYLVYVNPPYGRVLAQWSRKIVEEARWGVQIIVLVPSRTDTQWWSILWNARMSAIGPAGAALAFWIGRLQFIGAPDPAPFPSALFYFGPNPGKFCDVFSARCLTVILSR